MISGTHMLLACRLDKRTDADENLEKAKEVSHSLTIVPFAINHIVC